MQNEQVIDLLRQSLKVALLLSAPILAFGLIVGILTNVFQAVTQITESTLSFVPKLLAMVVALVLFSPWMLDILIDFTTHVFDSVPSFVR